MDRRESLIQETLHRLQASQAFALATIIGHEGSTPRTSGSAMLIKKDGTISGTIGGGLVEAKVIEAGVRMLDTPQSTIMDFTLDQDIKQGMDMVCGGSLTVWIQTFAPPFDPDMIRIYQTLADLETRGEKAALVTRVLPGGQGGKCLVRYKEGKIDEIKGPLVLPRPLMDTLDTLTGTEPVRFIHGLEPFIIEPLSPPDTLFIFGAGHVGYQLAKMAHFTGFAHEIIDDRAEFANPQRFPHARSVHVKAFPGAFEGLAIDPNSYIVILTRGHLHDQTVLEQALDTPAPYIGMIGSRRKRDQIYTNLMAKGIEQSRLDPVYSPIGIRIQAETPAEIAVSIMGELILARAQNRGRTKTGH